uniref:Uncharacterized protein n=1 Tax=Clastoptera arizonana TaxID=38151 RepID=A0A1B6CHA0_9HEMI
MVPESDKKCFCLKKRLVVHFLDAVTLMVVLIFQGTVLNYYLIFHNKDSSAPYFYFILDILVIVVFIGTLTSSYSYLTKREAHEERMKKVFALSPSRITQVRLPFPPSKLGTTPFSYISWTFYIIILLSKVVIIFESKELIEKLSEKDHFGPQLLKITIAAASLVFLLLVEGHNWAKRGTTRYSFVTSTCGKNGIEIFDSVSFLSILMEGLPISSGFKDVILVLSTFTFFLPALSLYKLSMLDFASEKTCLQITVVYNLLRLTLVDIPFLIVRLYLWAFFHQNASLFLMKNIFNIILVLRCLYPDLIALSNEHFHFHQERHTKEVPDGTSAFEEVVNADAEEKKLTKMNTEF